MNEMNKIIAGRYVLKELIGQGGMADVYLAEDSILKRTVAVKIMRSSLNGDPVYVTRFHREASAAAALTHKNIVQIYDVGEDGDDYFIVMEYVPGQTLKELIHKRGALHYVEAVDIMKQVVSATAKAHSMGIIHRDLKPQNIMVTDSGVVKIGDFGIASIQSLSQVTQTDTIMGSLHYLAPEIARGEKATIQSDIYALGIVFYELLRGEVPFNGESPVNIALKHMRDDIPSVREFNPSILQSVENIIIKATAKNVHNRYLSASDMLDDLSTCLSRENEEKLVFDYVEDHDTATIVADDKDFFTQTQKQMITPVQEEEKKEEQPVKEVRKKRSDQNLPQKKKTLNKKKIALIGGIVAGVIILCVVIYFAFLKPVDNFSMPDVIGLTQEEAIEILKEKGLVINEKVNEELSDEYEKGMVTQTDPEANDAVQKGDEVTLTVSSGKYIIMKDYTGSQYSEAETELRELGFIVKKVTETNDDTKNKILNQSIEPGEKIDPNTVSERVVTLTVSKGYSRTVPNVYGQSVSKAKSILEEAGFIVKTKILTPPTSAEEIKTMKINVVMTQSIKAFTVVTVKGKTITIGYYDHKPALPSEEPTPQEPTTPPTTENN